MEVQVLSSAPNSDFKPSQDISKPAGHKASRVFCCVMPSHGVPSKRTFKDGTFDGTWKSLNPCTVLIPPKPRRIWPEQSNPRFFCAVMPLTESEAVQATAKAKPFKLSDGHGLYLLVKPNGAKLWRFDYRFTHKRKTLALGMFPTVPLIDAREKRDDARRMIAGGVDPAEHRKAGKTTQPETPPTPEPVSLRFVLADIGGLEIETKTARLSLTPDQTAALRVFLDATKAETEGKQPC